MATAAVLQMEPKDFKYEDLISRVQTIQNQMESIKTVLENRSANQNSGKSMIKSRSLTIIDPYGHPMTESYDDHELLKGILKEFKKNYIPKYLHQWIRFGIQDQDSFKVLDDVKLGSMVSNYKDGFIFTTFGEVTVLLGNFEGSTTGKFTFQVLLNDSVETIKNKLAKHVTFNHIELRSYIVDAIEESKNINWNRGTALRSDDTILSKTLYKKNCVIIAKVSKAELSDFQIFVKILSGKTQTYTVNSATSVETLKTLISGVEGIPVDGQRLIFRGGQLENHKTLQQYGVIKENTLHLVLRLRGGMYHFTSGRQDFSMLPSDSAEAIKNILTLTLPHANSISSLSFVELQDYLIRAQSVLEELYHSSGYLNGPANAPKLGTVLLSPININWDDDSEDDDVSI